MSSQNLVWSSVGFVLRDVIGDVLYFPIWWYTEGMARIGRQVTTAWLDFMTDLGIPILTRSLFKPMYGDYTWSGRLISFPVRFVHLTVLCFVALIWGLVLFVLFLAWILFPLFLGYNIAYQLFGFDTHVIVLLLNKLF